MEWFQMSLMLLLICWFGSRSLLAIILIRQGGMHTERHPLLITLVALSAVLISFFLYGNNEVIRWPFLISGIMGIFQVIGGGIALQSNPLVSSREISKGIPIYAIPLCVLIYALLILL